MKMDTSRPPTPANYPGGNYLLEESEKAPRTNTRQFCARCQSVDRVGFLAPKDLWRLVAGPRWEHDILCLACFAEIGDEKGIAWDVPKLEFYPVSYVTLARIRDTGDAE